MIAVIANSSEHAVVREFFELFKTPWEFYRSSQQYEVLLCAGDGNFDESTAKLVLVYAGHKLPYDAVEKIEIASQEKNARMLSYEGSRIPIYGHSLTFRQQVGVLVDEESRESGLQRQQSRGSEVVRIGYDIFSEVRALLTAGQPVANAESPTLELHIAILRDLIVASGVRLIEIPPVPAGYRFTACLTHDVDHPSIRRHKFDHTMFGFLYRAILGSLFDVLRERAPLRNLWINWAAALKLPLVHLGLAKDCWLELDRYVKIEDGLPSSFFVIPFEGRPGRSHRGPAPSHRGARYGAADITGQLEKLRSAGCEVGLHGIDAWFDTSCAREELEQIRQITGKQEVGVRMHWLYFDDQSPVTLENAGADYDSTFGYNETVGYRAGTTQAFKPLGTTRLIELPLHVMDTALFFRSYLDLSPRAASQRVGYMIDNAVQFGGSVTVNWHDRSIAPERLWGDFYADLVGVLKSRGAWFATSGQAVSWFRKRRSASFEHISWESGALRVTIALEAGDRLPDLQLRVHNGGAPHQNTVISVLSSERPGDLSQKHTIDACVALS